MARKKKIEKQIRLNTFSPNADSSAHNAERSYRKGKRFSEIDR